MSSQPTTLIIGAGPAGLTAALKLLRQRYGRVVIVESSNRVGGMATTLPLGSGLIDVGGHRFHTASSRVGEFWNSIPGVNWNWRERFSELVFEKKRYTYPLSLSLRSLNNFGVKRSLTAAQSLLEYRRKEINSLEDFFKATYGPQLFEVFFQTYTRKVWGRDARDILPSWGHQRLKRPGLISQSSEFRYPTGGPGAVWEEVRKEILRLGGEIKFQTKILGLQQGKDHSINVETSDGTLKFDSVISSAPLSQNYEWVTGKKSNLPYRALISVNLVCEIESAGKWAQWTYINDSDVRLSRVQNYRAWDESMVPNPKELILGVEYFADVDDSLWTMTNEALVSLATAEISKLNATPLKVTESRVVRLPQAYPCYWGDYQRIHDIQIELDQMPHFYSVGRNGLHRYINMDQAMMSAMHVVDFIVQKKKEKHILWQDFEQLHLPE